MKARALLGLTALAASLAGCGSSPSVADSPAVPRVASAAPVTGGTALPSTEKLDPSAITVTAVAVPAQLVIDGDPIEWGALDVLPPVPTGAVAQKRGASHVAVALDAKVLRLVGSLTGAAKAGFTLGLRFEAPEMPAIGIAQRSGGVIGLGDCTTDTPGFGLPIDQCREVTAAYDRWVAAEAARFVRTFHIDASGISATSATAPKTLDARFQSKPTADGFTFEAELPLAALPRVAAAPITDIGVAAGTGTVLAPEAFVLAGLPNPVVFEPLGALRQHAFQFGRMGSFGRVPISYQPGDPNKVEVIGRDGSALALESSERALFTRLGGAGDVEFGLLDVVGPVVIVLLAGVPTEFLGMNETPTNIVRTKFNEVDGWLIVSPWVRFLDDVGAGYYAGFDTAFVGTNGWVGSGFWTSTLGGVIWENVSPTVSADLETLTISGAEASFGSKTRSPPRTLVWKLDHHTGYVAQP